MMRTPTGEPFELLNQLGRGGFATTWRARVIDPDLKPEFGEIVAVKVPHGKREAKVLKSELELNAGLHMRLRKFRSPNLVRYLGFELFQGGIVMVMEFVPEGSLRTLLSTSPYRLAPEDARTITQGILRGLALIHREEIVHRDIKPENILMNEGIPKIADFGIARILETGKLANTQAGTIPYMSPEILSDDGGSYPSDLWSTGVTLYEMVTGRRPFGDQTTSIRQLIDLICNYDPVPAHEACRDVPRPLSDVIARALTKDPKKRFANADEMCRALEPPEKPTDEPLERELEFVRTNIENPGQADALEVRLTKLVHDYPGDFRAYQHLAEILLRRQRLGDAVDLLRSAVKVAPDNGTLQWRLALTLRQLGDKPAAIAALQRALDLGLPDNLRVHAARLLGVLSGPPS